MKASGTGLVDSDYYLIHDTGAHPESAQRLVAIRNRLRETGLLDRLARIEPRAAEIEALEAVHSPEYVRWVKEAIEGGAEVLDLGDTAVSRDSYRAARFAAGGVLAAVDAVTGGTVRNCFAAVRPPGHHALADRAMGFCIFNNVAIGARYAQKRHGIKRILIVDWDVHHGNGTQEIFYRDPSVLYFSTHQFPHYPGSGDSREKGEGSGEGFTINVPLPAGSADAEYEKAFREKLVPALPAFRPELVLVSAGFDAHRDDPLAGMSVSTEGFGRLTEIVKGIAEEYASGRLVSVLEGGYHLESLADSVAVHIQKMME